MIKKRFDRFYLKKKYQNFHDESIFDYGSSVVVRRKIFDSSLEFIVPNESEQYQDVKVLLSHK